MCDYLLLHIAFKCSLASLYENFKCALTLIYTRSMLLFQRQSMVN